MPELIVHGRTLLVCSNARIKHSLQVVLVRQYMSATITLRDAAYWRDSGCGITDLEYSMDESDMPLLGHLPGACCCVEGLVKRLGADVGAIADPCKRQTLAACSLISPIRPSLFTRAWRKFNLLPCGAVAQMHRRHPMEGGVRPLELVVGMSTV